MTDEEIQELVNRMTKEFDWLESCAVFASFSLIGEEIDLLPLLRGDATKEEKYKILKKLDS